jgi:arginine decarboxylase
LLQDLPSSLVRVLVFVYFSNTPMIDALDAFSRADPTLFCTPGHKQGKAIPAAMARLIGNQAYGIDLPDLPGFNLFEPDGYIAAAQVLAAQTFGAAQTWFLVNGSTVGVMASILATCGPGDKIIVPRNVHRSAIAGLILSGAHPVFIAPEYDPQWDLVHCITPASVAAALAQYPETKAVLMVSPTYHGVGGDVGAIAQLAHQHNIPLLVDEAHGAHFGVHPDLPPTALTLGADLVVQSTHKTLCALTQASMLHQQGSIVDGRRVSAVLQMLQSSSPSNLLLASLEATCQQMKENGQALMAQTLALAHAARESISSIPGLSILSQPQTPTAGFCYLDATRLTVDVSGCGLNGFTADEICTKQFGIIAELPTLRHLTFILSLGNGQADVDRLICALQSLSQDSSLDKGTLFSTFRWTADTFPVMECPPLSPRDAFFTPRTSIPIAQAAGYISAETLCPYPPGIPITLPGERITSAQIEVLQQIQASGGLIVGCADQSLQTIGVVL